MCFDDQVLSAFYDDELEGVWKDRVGKHVQVCSRCAAKLTSFGKLGEKLAAAEMPDISFRQQAVWERIRHSISTEEELGFWYRKISVVKTAAAIAAASVIVFGISLFLNGFSAGGEIGTSGDVASVFSHSSQEVIKTDEMNRLIELLSVKEDPSEFVIKLPEDHTFRYLGEPQFLREADFVRGR